MSESKNRTWIYLVVVLLFIVASTLFSIERELKAQRTPDLTAQIDMEAEVKKQDKARLQKEQEMEQARLRDMPWIEVEGINQYVSKGLAHRYHFYLFGLALGLATATLLIKRFVREMS